MPSHVIDRSRSALRLPATSFRSQIAVSVPVVPAAVATARPAVVSLSAILQTHERLHVLLCISLLRLPPALHRVWVLQSRAYALKCCCFYLFSIRWPSLWPRS